MGCCRLANFEKDLAQDILKGKRLSAAQLGLRFDKVVVDVLADLRSFVEAAAAGDDLCFAVTISAPVRRRAATVDDLKTKMVSLLSKGVPQADIDAVSHGNKVRLRLMKHSKSTPTRLIGFVHNPESASEPLLDLAEQWLLERGSPTTPPSSARPAAQRLGSSSAAEATPFSAGAGLQQSVFSQEQGRDPVFTRTGTIAGGLVHNLPTDLQAALIYNEKALSTWQDLTPIARNEWICWIESAKRADTRGKRIIWGCENLRDGKRRPCCWPGCSHRQRTTAPAR